MSKIKATKTKSTFRMECAVNTNINSSPEKIWNILTNAAKYVQWNSTIISLEGKIALGEKIKLKVKLDPKRTFNLKISEFSTPVKMVWEDGMAPMFKGVRTYTLVKNDDGTTGFTMSEVFSGLMLPMIAGSLPDFAPAFEQFALDLKKEAEKN